MAREGRDVLTQIPGVLGVSFGEAVAPNASYRFVYVVEFEDESVIERYRHHPVHVRFADSRFRPLAPDRITTDFRMHECDGDSSDSDAREERHRWIG